MAFSSPEKANIRFYLGFQDQFRDVNTTLESQMAGGMSTDGETLTRSILASLDDVDTKIVAAHSRLKAKKVGSIDLPGGDELIWLRGEGRRFVARLATMFGVAPKTDVYGEGFGSSLSVVPLG